MRQKPSILQQQIVARSRLFCIEQLQLRFSNGAERTYERLISPQAGYGAVMIVALKDSGEALLIEEYCAGTDEYQISLPKGLVELGEDILSAANRELQEETGFGAHHLEIITTLSLSPGYMSHSITVVLARDLYPQSLAGDEPEPLDLHSIHLGALRTLVAHPKCTEGRALAALYIVRDLLIEQGRFTV